MTHALHDRREWQRRGFRHTFRCSLVTWVLCCRWEDRHMPKQKLSTAERVLSVDPATSHMEATTTKQQVSAEGKPH